MSKDMKDMTLTEFCDKVASNEPAPGGGSVGALAGGLAAALAAMVGALTVGKKGYEAHAAEMEKTIAACNDLQKELLVMIQTDSSSFNEFMDAMGMPKNTDEEKAARTAAMQKALKYAASVPMKSAELALQIMPHALAVVKNGNKNAVTDGLVAGMLSRTAVLSCLLNVKINLGSIKDEAFVADMTKKIADMEKQAIAAEKEIFAASELTQY